MARFSLKAFSLWLAALACLLAAPAGAVSIDMVTVGNAGNSNDTVGNGYGAVAYDYQIGKYDVTIGQYTAFLNAADPTGTNPNGIYRSVMATDANIAGILYTSGASTGSKYSVMTNSGDSSNRPIAIVTWFDAARFSNWMTNGQGNGSTETGAYNLATAAAGVAPAKTPGAAFYIPNENEWYKAAYYSPMLNHGSGGYYAYATQSDTDPGNVGGSAANQANIRAGGLFSVSQSGSYSASQQYLTDVGAFVNSGSYYGTFDQTGNVFEWNDLDGTAGTSRGERGGYWASNAFYSSSSYSYSLAPSHVAAYGGIGFRLASPVSGSAVPEIDPNGLSAALGLIAAGLGLLERRRYGR